MTIWQAIRYCIVRKYASGKGRASLGEFLSYFFAYLIFSLFWFLLIAANIDYFGDWNLIDFVLLYIPFLFAPPLIAVTVRRLHDSGRSGFFIYLFLIPLFNIFALGLLFARGQAGPNIYGPPPHGLKL